MTGQAGVQFMRAKRDRKKFKACKPIILYFAAYIVERRDLLYCKRDRMLLIVFYILVIPSLQLERAS